MKAESIIKPNKFTFERHPRGGYILWLRENFHEVTTEDEQDEPVTNWVYDEYTLLMPNELSDSFIEQHFSEYITEARQKDANDADKRLTAIESAIIDLAEIMGGASNG